MYAIEIDSLEALEAIKHTGDRCILLQKATPEARLFTLTDKWPWMRMRFRDNARVSSHCGNAECVNRSHIFLSTTQERLWNEFLTLKRTNVETIEDVLAKADELSLQDLFALYKRFS